MEITPPPFPFEHMVSPNPTMNLDNGSNGGSYATSISSSSADTLEQSNSKPVHRTFEIELATQSIFTQILVVYFSKKKKKEKDYGCMCIYMYADV